MNLRCLNACYALLEMHARGKIVLFWLLPPIYGFHSLSRRKFSIDQSFFHDFQPDIGSPVVYKSTTKSESGISSGQTGTHQRTGVSGHLLHLFVIHRYRVPILSLQLLHLNHGGWTSPSTSLQASRYRTSSFKHYILKKVSGYMIYLY